MYKIYLCNYCDSTLKNSIRVINNISNDLNNVIDFLLDHLYNNYYIDVGIDLKNYYIICYYEEDFAEELMKYILDFLKEQNLINKNETIENKNELD